MSKTPQTPPKFKIGDKVLYKPFESSEGKEMCIISFGTNTPNVPLAEIELYWNGTYLCKWFNDPRNMPSFYEEKKLEKIGECDLI